MNRLFLHIGFLGQLQLKTFFSYFIRYVIPLYKIPMFKKNKKKQEGPKALNRSPE